MHIQFFMSNILYLAKVSETIDLGGNIRILYIYVCCHKQENMVKTILTCRSLFFDFEFDKLMSSTVPGLIDVKADKYII